MLFVEKHQKENLSLEGLILNNSNSIALNFREEVKGIWKLVHYSLPLNINVKWLLQGLPESFPPARFWQITSLPEKMPG